MEKEELNVQNISDGRVDQDPRSTCMSFNPSPAPFPREPSRGGDPAVFARKLKAYLEKIDH